MNLKILVLSVVIVALNSSCNRNDLLWSENNNKLIEISLIPEMVVLAELRDWQSFQLSEYKNEINSAQQKWQSQLLWVQTKISNKTAQTLSCWASDEMKTYSTQPILKGVAIEPVAINPERTRMLFKGIIDRLPSHSRLVSRWLEMFIVYDVSNASINKVIFTIEGQRFE